MAEDPTDWADDMTHSIGKFQPVMLECVKAELEQLGAASGKKAKVARLALSLASGFRLRSNGSGMVDDEIVSAALEDEASVATTDRELAQTLMAAHVNVIQLRSGRVYFR